MHKQYQNMKYNKPPNLYDEEEEARKQKQKRQELAQKRFAKARFYQQREQRQKNGEEDLIYDEEKETKKVFTKREKYELYMKEYGKYNLTQLCQEEGIDLENPDLNIKWLPLYYFDDTTMETIFIDSTINFDEVFSDEKGEHIMATAQALYKQSEDSEYEWAKVRVWGYDEQENRLICTLLDNPDQEKKLIPRIFVCFDIEHPCKYARRLAYAFQRRLNADSLIRYKFYVSAMPNEHLSEISTMTRQNLDDLVRIKRLENCETTSLMMEICQDYAYTMNEIIFDKYLGENQTDLVPHSLVLPQKNNEQQIPDHRLLDLNKGPLVYMFNPLEVFKVPAMQFAEIFKQFSNQTLYRTPETIDILHFTKEECNTILNYEFFKLTTPQTPYKLEDFQSEQETSCHTTLNKLKQIWVPNIVKIVKEKLNQTDGSRFNLKEDSMEVYEQGKLKRFFTLINTIMQDSLLYLCQKSFKNYCNYIESFIPKEVTIEAANNITNIFKSDYKMVSTDDETQYSSQAIKPLFQLELLKNPGQSEEDEATFYFSKSPEQIVQIIQQIFDKLIDDINKIPNVERTIMHELFRNSGMLRENQLKAPRRDKEKVQEFQNQQQKLAWNENQWVNDLYAELTSQIQHAVEPLKRFLQEFEPYKPILKMNPEAYAKEYDNQEQPVEIGEITKEIKINIEKKKQLLATIPQTIQVSSFKIDCQNCIKYLADKYQEVVKLLEDIIARRAKNQTNELYQKMREIKEKVLNKPENIEKLSETLDYMEAIPTELEKIKKDINASMETYKVIESLQIKLGEEDIKKKWMTYQSPKDIVGLIDDQKKILEKEKVRFRDLMDSEEENFKTELKEVQTTILNFSTYTNMSAHADVANIAIGINEKLKEFQERARKFNVQQGLFGRELTDYSLIQTLIKDFHPYQNLWITSNQWFKNIDHWMNGSWESLDAPHCERFVEEAFKTFNSVIRFFKEKNIDPVLKIAQQVKGQLDQFRPKVPLMVALRKNGMYSRHWEEISEKVGIEVQPNEDFTFTKCLDLGLLNHLEVCMEIGEKASKEYHIEQQLKQMLDQWEDINFDLKSYKNLTYIIGGYDDLNNLLDEHIVTTQSMQFSPFKKPFEEEIIEWNNNLKLISDVLEEWAKYQVNWMYLQPIFDSPDISKQLPGESKKFKMVDTTWKQTMNMVKQYLNVKRVCTTEGLLQKLKDNNESLEIIQKALNDYLERKREAFARFYFLSNDELLEILSETKDPTKVQPHLRKVFENIDKLEFDEEKKMHSMFSAENEQVPFVEEIDPVGKNVEDWMGEVEKMMKCSIRKCLKFSVDDYKQRARIDWVSAHPGMCVLNGSQIVWTHEVEEALQQNQVKKYWEKQGEQLNDLVKLVRQKLTPNQKITINALIVMDVHAKDVVEKLWQGDIQSIQAFEWISQLRFYWEKNLDSYDERVDKSHDEDCWVRCVQTHFPYGYEYLGNTLRLVITPLTDKCYMTLMGALKLNLGGAPAGPAGTGKTESTKDLAKALAKQCVVFNCSDQMDYIMVGKFFKGLASAGAWCCFDEFNRINIEVLSVIAQQLRKLFDEKIKGSSFVENFEGSNIRLKKTFNVYITMNPGYAGRTELPDNLKALFRGVAMMVPDYAMIGEIMLYSFGFSEGRALAKKMVVTFKLSSEQLSSQDHYDYGMRAVRSVINAAGLLKPAHPNEVEEKLLLRALRDVNVPKFLKDDIPLFENIILDIFPGIEKPVQEYGNLIPSIHKTCEELNLSPNDPFVNKIIQLYDTIQVRHGMMLVGPTGGGKTSNYRVLSQAISKLHKEENFYKVHTHVLNPKSITMGQLYGMFSEATREWQDGVVAYIIRECCKDRTTDRHWVQFDGPVDAIWIESMNTVLDDNKKLCLNSGQILALTAYMVIMFEVEDLAVASPATVSRCGMVYMEPVSMGVQPLIDCWINAIPENFKIHSKTFQKYLRELFDKYFFEAIEFMRKNISEVITTMDNNIVQSLERILNCTFNQYIDTELKKIQPEEIQNVEQQLESIFLYALIWSVGCTGNFEGREKFNEYLIQKMEKSGLKDPLPLAEHQGASVYDFRWDIQEKTWIQWKESYKNFQVDSELLYNEVIIPTNDSTRNIYNMKMLIKNKHHCLMPGPTGTGKSVNAQDLIINKMGEEYQYIPISFSAQTSANQTQDTIDSKIQKRRRGIYGPPVGKRCIVFVDDLNMPKKEQYGAQPPLELIRQFMDHEGWYERKSLQFHKLEDMIFLSAMGPPGGARAPITGRLKRHFNIIAYTELDQLTIKSIFITLTQAFLEKFSQEVRDMIPELVQKTLEVYQSCKKELLPTPKKSHYTFNLRDMSKTFQGICNASQKNCSETIDIVRLWYHENMRIFHDRLIEEGDREKLKEMLYSRFGSFGMQKEEVLDQERILFLDFWNGKEVDRQYQYATDLEILTKKMYENLEEYNNDPSFAGATGKNAMKLVLFLDACEHICRITRILRQPMGNALLLGVGGSGRQSLSKMATFLSNYNLFQIQVIKGYNMKSWRDDIKTCLMKCGVEQSPTTFLFVDTQIINEQQVEDLNSILNSGDVANIYQDADMEEISNACKGDCMRKNIQPNKMNIFSQYLQRVKNNIHLVIAMSPLSPAFQTRLRMFPSLVNNCTLDWFTEWPEEALIGVGKGQLEDFSNEMDISPEDLSKYVENFKVIHKSVEKSSSKYLLELNRTNHVTPTSYLELLTMFKQIMREKQVQSQQAILRLKTGLDRLIEANKQVQEMEKQLTEDQPKLEKKQTEVEQLVEKIAQDTKEAEETEKIVSAEEALANKQAQEAQKLKDEAEASVKEANETLDVVLKQIAQLKKNHLDEVKSLKTPPAAANIILGAMCYLLQDELAAKGQKGIIMENVPGQIGKKEENYFKTAMIMFNSPDELLNILKKTYDKENINPKYIQQLETKVYNGPFKENFTLEKASSCSLAIKFIYIWVDAMFKFHKVFTETQPLRDKLQEQQSILDQKMAELKEKKEMNEAIQNKLRRLKEQHQESINEIERLQENINECKLKLERAIKLTQGLASEKVRWGQDIETLQAKEVLISGNSIVGAGMVAYLGAFTSQYRKELTDLWLSSIEKSQVPHTPEVKMSQFLGDPVKIQHWNLCGLPKDDTSIENGIIIDKSRRWPLMIDPQTQANKYIKNLGQNQSGESQMVVVKMSDPTLMRTLENAIQYGQWVLVENVGQTLDPSLEPILLQQVVKVGSSLSITIGEKQLTYNESFKFFMTTTNPNPSYSPETFVKVCIINFAITPSGLEDQMLAIIVGLEQPTLEMEKSNIVKKNAEDNKKLYEIEETILKSLQQSSDINELLKDETLINTLQNAKKFAQEINIRMKDSKITEQKIDEAREGYRPVAYRASILFFCIVDLNRIDPMYEYSLQWFINLFEMGVKAAPSHNEQAQRLLNLNSYFTLSLYENVCRSLFEKHKLIFSFMLTISIQQGDHLINQHEWRYLLTGPTGDIPVPNNITNWLDNNTWTGVYKQIYAADHLEALAGFKDEFMKNPDVWKDLFDSEQPEAMLDQLPGEYKNKSDFQKIILLKCFRSDKVNPAIANYITKYQGKEFITPPTFDLAKCYKDSNCTTPLIFVLSSGSDPVSDFKRFAEEMEMSNRYDSTSLGQGQGKKAEKIIRDNASKGGWVLLQNCHLAQSWMPELERIVEEFSDQLNPDFRLWLTSMPSKHFPISVLQNGVKMTLEPPQGLKMNLKRSYDVMNDQYLNDCKQPEPFKKLMFGFCFFHAIIQDRRKFGPIGWNIPYEFTNEDLEVCQRQLKMLLDEFEEIPWKVINFLGAEINYGGRVTDDKDVRLIKNILVNYINPKMLEDNFKLSESGIYYSPVAGEKQDYINYIESLPLFPQPEAFGLHNNAEITNAQNETRILLETILSVQPRSSGGEGKSREEIIDELAEFVQNKTPPIFDYEAIFEKFPTDYKESMNTVLIQEVVRYNRLLAIMKTSLVNVRKALKGLVVMSEELELMANQMFDNIVPDLFSDKGFLSLKPLASWVIDLNDRVDFLNSWIKNGTPVKFWISGFFFPQAFITGILQNYARKETVAVDRLSLDFQMLDHKTPDQINEKPDVGAIVYGIFIEGARWDKKQHTLSSSNPKELFSDLPPIHLIPKPDRKQPESGIYNIPLYKVVSRSGTLSTTGHSTNFVMYMEVNSDKDENYWIVAGVACFLALRY